MLLPYNVERPTKLFPYLTYSIIGLNVFIFLMTLMVSNTHLPVDQRQGRDEIARILGGSSFVPAEGQGLGEWQQAEPQPASGDGTVPEARVRAALMRMQSSLKNPSNHDLRRLYQVRNVNEKFVLEPHYSTLELFAYRPGDPSPWTKLMGLFGSMFLHGGIEHLVGNLFLLWVFGRALEDALGPGFFAGIYISCGVAATLAFHIITVALFADRANLPLIGASGAISGVLGLFIVRFFRTRVRIFYLSLPLIIAVPVVGPILVVGMLLYFLFWYLLFAFLLGAHSAALVISGCIFAASVFLFGRNWAWGRFTAPSLWFIGGYMVVFNIFPALLEIVGKQMGSTAYWAHLGGFACGAIYALLIGGIEEGKSEYALEDAQDSLHREGTQDALDRAQKILTATPDNPAAMEVAARAMDRRGDLSGASPQYIGAINGYWKKGEKDAACRLYQMALEQHPALPVSPGLLAGLSGHLARQGMVTEAASALVRIIEEHPQAPEAEIALLRAAQMWMRDFKDPAEAARLYQAFLDTYPHSEYVPQAQQAASTALNLAASRNSASPQ